MLREEMYQEEESVFQQQEGLMTPAEKSGKRQRLRFILFTLVVTVIIGYLMYSGMQETMGYYVTVSELVKQGPQVVQAKLRVSGTVQEGSLSWNPGEQRLQFVMIDEKATLPVEYEGSVPDTLKHGQKVIAEGVYTHGTFVASELMTTCASKYE